MTSRGATSDRHETREQKACWKEGVALIGRIDMRKTVHEISKDYGIPPSIEHYNCIADLLSGVER